MKLRLLCNAGLAIEYHENTLFVDLPNGEYHPFSTLQDETWEAICAKRKPYENVAGFFFTHCHLDHYDKKRLDVYLERYHDTPYFAPTNESLCGELQMGEFKIEYYRIDHAPIPHSPPHIVSMITVGEKMIYISADAELNVSKHRFFINNRRADVAFWTPMYMSRADTRKLMEETAQQNYIYHMPSRTDGPEIWKKSENNLMRYPEELNTVTVLEPYPTVIDA